MKGFLSLLGITLIVGAFGLILLSFYGNPLEELRSQERMHAYIETRQNHSAEAASHMDSSVDPVKLSAVPLATVFADSSDSCERPAEVLFQP